MIFIRLACRVRWMCRGSIYKDPMNNMTEIWKFDKRFYTDPKDALKVCVGGLPSAGDVPESWQAAAVCPSLCAVAGLQEVAHWHVCRWCRIVTYCKSDSWAQGWKFCIAACCNQSFALLYAPNYPP